MKSLLARFVKDESGATAIEYGLIAALISLVVVGAGKPVGEALGRVFTKISTDLNTVAPPASGG